jgi:hypothetical protein
MSNFRTLKQPLRIEKKRAWKERRGENNTMSNGYYVGSAAG